mgnify:CR=1 FL=1
MSRFLFALAVGVAFASTSTAEDKPAATAPSPTPVVTAAPVMTYSTGTTSTARRGLFGRLRNRNASTVMSSPVTSGTIVTPAAGVPTPMPAITPKTTGGAGVVGNPVVVAGGTVVPASGTMVPGTTVVPASAMTSAPTTTKRMGVFARLRARR